MNLRYPTVFFADGVFIRPPISADMISIIDLDRGHDAVESAFEPNYARQTVGSNATCRYP